MVQLQNEVNNMQVSVYYEITDGSEIIPGKTNLHSAASGRLPFIDKAPRLSFKEKPRSIASLYVSGVRLKLRGPTLSPFLMTTTVKAPSDSVVL